MNSMPPRTRLRVNPSPSLPSPELWVCWTRPRQTPPADARFLSFLTPSEEAAWRAAVGQRLQSARELSVSVRAEARRVYLELVTRIGLVRCADGRTFRQSLARPGAASRWWYHPVAFRGCETDPTFDRIIAIHTIRALAKSAGARRLVLVGGPPSVAAVLRSAYDVRERQPQAQRATWRVWLRGLGSRLRWVIRTYREIRVARRLASSPHERFETVLAGFWNWSVRWDEQAHQLVDRYFKRLPDVLRQQLDGRLGWFLWLDAATEPDRSRRTLADCLRPLQGRRDAVILQRWLSYRDVVNTALDVGALRAWLAVRHQPAYAAAFEYEGLNYAPLFSARLLEGFLNASLPHRELVAVAVSRAYREYQPAISLHFLEHFPISRAWYEGVRQAGTRTICCAIQHAGYSHEKTFLWLDPQREWRGESDGCAVPHPDMVCAMGTLGQALFRECGYPDDRVLLTGSPRYDHVAVAPASRRPGPGPLTLLLALGLTPELDMVDAVCAAVRDIDGIRILVRNHPFSQIQRQARFAVYKHQVVLSQGSLADDLAQADAVLFTYSTVAEEALLMGKPVWQWMPAGFNGSALAEAADIPRLATVEALRDALIMFRAHPHTAVPSLDLRHTVLERLFYRADGRAAERVAQVIQALRAEMVAR